MDDLIDEMKKTRGSLYQLVKKQKRAYKLLKADYKSKNEEIDELVSNRYDVQQELRYKQKMNDEVIFMSNRNRKKLQEEQDKLMKQIEGETKDATGEQP